MPRRRTQPSLRRPVEAPATTRYRDERPRGLTPPLIHPDRWIRALGGDDLRRPALAGEMLRRDRSLAGRSIPTAAVISMLATDGSLATARGRPVRLGAADVRRVLACRQRRPRHSPLVVARLLLEHDADPNAGYLWDGTYSFTALNRGFGYGEDAPNQTSVCGAACARVVAPGGWGGSQRRLPLRRRRRHRTAAMNFTHNSTGAPTSHHPTAGPFASS